MTDAAGGALADAVLAARLCARDPRLGGMVLRGGGADAVLAALKAALPEGVPIRRLPAHADEAQLTGGIDLAAALAGQGLRQASGLLAAARGGVLVAPMAERMPDRTAATLAGALDEGELLVAALDEGVADEAVAPALAERLAFRVHAEREDSSYPREGGDPAAFQPPKNSGVPPFAGKRVGDDDAIALLATTAAALGIDSARAGLFALRAARAAAALDGRAELIDVDLDTAARLVLAPRATRLPASPDQPDAAPPEAGTSEPGEQDGSAETEALADRLLAAAHASIDADLIARLAAGGAGRGDGRRARGAGERRRSRTRGRPVGVRAGEPRGGARLALVETLRAAAPWQAFRGRTDRVLLQKSDLHIRRYEARAELVTIFAVDASGSAATARLAEAKGAVELLLGQAYVQRAEVALVAFRGATAELLLPPTRSLARARRALGELPGGGGTPLAAGIAAVRGLALAARAKGRTPFVVILSDGRANIAADGTAGRATAERDALAAARALAADGIAAVFVDTGPRARPEGARLAEAMRARYLPLPFAGPEAVGAAVSALAPRRI